MKSIPKEISRTFLVLMLSLVSFVCLLAQINDSEVAYGKVSFSFIHVIKGQPVHYDTIIYVNNSGNRFEVNQVQYFISEIRLHGKTGENLIISPSKPWHYIDKDYPNTLYLHPDDKIPAGVYDSLSFIFGLSKETNRSYRFRNPPESIMFWPDVLGGGYHYMKINVRYLDNDNQVSNFNCHLGIGQSKNEQGKITGFIQNCFRVTLPATALTIRKDKISEISIIMDIEKWFGPPNLIDFNNYGGIMDNQEAMSKICSNGAFVFYLKTDNKDDK